MPSIRSWHVCGFVAPLLSVATDVLACNRWPAHQPTTQSISELTAIGAPTRSLVTGLDLVRDVSLAIFGAALSQAASNHQGLRATGSLVLASAVIDAFATAFLPRDYTQPTWSRRNTVNTAVMAAGVGCSIGAMGAGAVAIPGWFRLLSAGIPFSYAFLIMLSLATASRRATSTPATGAQERTMAYSYQLWVSALALVLMHRNVRPLSSAPHTP